VAEVSVASSEFGGEQSIGLCVVGFLPPTGLYNTVLRVRCGAPVYVAVLRRVGAVLGHEHNPAIRPRCDSGRVC